MLIENRSVKQEAGAGRRRWFESDGLELVVWLDARGGVEGFQLCYARTEGERALTWRTGQGFTHSSVDSGNETPLKNKTPVLNPDGEVPWAELAALFKLRCATVEPMLRELILARLAARS